MIYWKRQGEFYVHFPLRDLWIELDVSYVNIYAVGFDKLKVRNGLYYSKLDAKKAQVFFFLTG